MCSLYKNWLVAGCAPCIKTGWWQGVLPLKQVGGRVCSLYKNWLVAGCAPCIKTGWWQGVLPV